MRPPGSGAYSQGCGGARPGEALQKPDELRRDACGKARRGIYWNNHHHLLMATERVSGLVLWANLHLLFWLSLIPFTTGWLGENEFAATPAAANGIVLLAASLAYFALQGAIIHAQGKASTLGLAIGRDLKGKVSPLLYALGIGLAFVNRWLSVAIYVTVALMWLVPDRRVERTIAAAPRRSPGAPPEP